MNTALFSIVDNNIFSILLMLLIIINIHVGKREESYSAKFMLLMCWSTIIVLFLDLTAWLFLDIKGPVGFYLVYVSNFLLFLFNPLTPVFWLMYSYIHLNGRFLSRKEILIFCIPLYVNSLMMVLSIFTGFVFTVDEWNQYHRGPGVVLVALIDYTTIMAAFYYALTHRNKINRKFMATVVAFSIIPIAGSLLQILFYGISASWPSMALGILLTYIFMEIQKSVRDHLTGLVNRRQFEEIIHSRMTGVKKQRGFSLIIADMNDFKDINDQFGHEAGDRALQEAATILSRSVGVNDVVGRLGGDEFIILLDASEKDLIETVKNRIDHHLDQWNGQTAEPFRLSISLGHSVYTRSSNPSYPELIKEADTMMYADKKERKARRFMG